MSKPKISVIVPIYKVEPYLRRCLDSILAQSCENLELILVDDGSPDNCPAICDEYAAKDGRVRVIHQENGGVSAARNAALAIATGDWLGWVDGDDWIEPDMYAYMLENALAHGADVAVCSRIERYPDRDVFQGWDRLQVWDRERAVGELLEDKALRNYLCDKLWRRELFADVRFPEGEIFEDISVTGQLYLKLEKMVVLPQAKYNYRQRAGSIVKSRSFAQQLSYVRAVGRQMETLRPAWPQYEAKLAALYLASAVGLWMTYGGAPRAERARCRGELRQIAAVAGQYQETVPQYRELGLAGRLILRLMPYDTWWSFALARWVGRLYRWRHGEDA